MIRVLAFDLGGVLFSDGTQEFIAELHRVFGVEPARAGEDELEARWVNGYRLNEATRDLIREVSQRYDVYFLSDNVAERVTAVERRYGFLSLFKGGVFSHEAGVRKPDRRIYELLLQRAQVQARQVLFVDDKDWALVPAARLGMKTVLFRDVEQVRLELVRWGVLPGAA